MRSWNKAKATYYKGYKHNFPGKVLSDHVSSIIPKQQYPEDGGKSYRPRFCLYPRLIWSVQAVARSIQTVRLLKYHDSSCAPRNGHSVRM